MSAKTTRKAPVTTTSNLVADETGAPVPGPRSPASSGVTVAEMNEKPKRRVSVPVRVKRLGTIASHILANRGRETKIQLLIAADLRTAEPMFIGDDGKPGTLPIQTTGLQGETVTSDLSFYDWAETVCRLNYSSVRQYLQAARFDAAHPTAAVQVESVKGLAVLEAAEARKPEAVAAILAELPATGATIAAVESAIAKHAPKPSKPKKVQDTSKVQTALELAARDAVEPLLGLLPKMDPAVMVEVQNYAEKIAAMATDPNIGKGSPVFALALASLHRSWNERTEAASKRTAKK